jgi:flagellar hook assembly protein FlgD
MQTRHRPRTRQNSGMVRATRPYAGNDSRLNFNWVSFAVVLGVIALVAWMFPREWLAKPNVTVTSDRSAFSPNGDGVQDDIAAFYTLSENGTVTVQVLNSAGMVMRTLMQEQGQTDGQHALTWDGRDDGGQPVPDGLYRVVVTANGIARQSEHSIPVEVDTAPPRLQLANFPDDLTTRETNFTIEGTTDPNITLLVSGDPRPIPVDTNGVFRVNRMLNEGINPLDIRAVDGAGNESLVSRVVTVRTQPPTLTITEPIETNSFVSNSLIAVRGTVPPDVSVTVNGREAVVDERGSFALDIVLDEGENRVTIVARDEVGNESRNERLITLRSQGPRLNLTSVPDGLTVRDPSLRVSGQVEPGSTLQVNGETVPVDANGNFSTLIVLQGGNNLLTVTATDIAGNATSVQRTVHYATGSTAVTTTPDFDSLTLPEMPQDPILWRVLIGVGVLGIGFLVFGKLNSPMALDITADYPTFYPNRNSEQRLLVLRLNLSRGARVDIDVYDEFNRHVMSLVERRPFGEGEHFRLWDGRSERGSLVGEGSYLIQATARTMTATATSAVWVRMDNTPEARRRTAPRRYYEEHMNETDRVSNRGGY